MRWNKRNSKMKKVKDLRKEYELAVAEGRESFTIDGFEFLTKFAKYTLEFMDMKGIKDSMPLKDILRHTG
jgi:hypothetical protein